MKSVSHKSFLAPCLVAILVLTSGCGALQKRAQAKRASESQQQHTLSPEQMQAKMVEAGTPSEFHHALKPLVGRWNVNGKMWMDPTQPPQETIGTSEFRWIENEHYLEQRYESSFNGQPFTGRGLIAYNNLEHQYQSTWIDSMSTQIMVSEGKIDPSMKVLTMEGRFLCPMTDSTHVGTSVLTMLSPDSFRFEMFDDGGVGARNKVMELNYERVAKRGKSKHLGAKRHSAKHHNMEHSRSRKHKRK